MAWLEKATLDLTNAQHEEKVCEIVKDFVIENHWNTPFIIKTGTMRHNTKVRSDVTMTLDSMGIYLTKWRDDEIEIVKV